MPSINLATDVYLGPGGLNSAVLSSGKLVPDVPLTPAATIILTVPHLAPGGHGFISVTGTFDADSFGLYTALSPDFAGWNGSTYYTLRSSIISSTATTQTFVFPFGAGFEDYDAGVAAGERYVALNPAVWTEITAISYGFGAPPTMGVYLDDGTGTYPTDISDRMSLTEPAQLSGFGRSDEFDQAQAATLTLTLRNDDGLFTSGADVIAPGTGIRWTETLAGTTYTRFTGVVSAVNLGWDGGPGFRSDVVVTAVDAFSALTRRPLRSMLEEEILLDSPTAYYTLGEAEGSTSAGDTSGNGNPSLTITGGGTALAFGATDSGLIEGTGATFANGQYLTGPSFTPTTAGVYSLVFRLDITTAATNCSILKVGPYSLNIVSGNLQVSQPGVSGINLGAVSTSFSDGPHTFAFVSDGSQTVAYVDVNGTIGPSSTAPSSSYADTFIGFDDGFTGTIDNVAIYDATLTDPEVQAIFDATLVAETTTDARLARLAAYAGLSVSSPVSTRLVGPQATSGQSVFDAMQAVVVSEGGVLFVDGSGVITMQLAGYRGEQTTAAASFGTGEVGVDTQPAYDTALMVNQATVTRVGGAEQKVGSPTENVYPASVDVILTTDAEALALAQWIVAKNSSPQVRIATMTSTNLLTSPNAADWLNLQIGDRISLSALPSQMYASATDYTVEGWSETSGVNEWTMTLNLLPWSLFEVGIYDDAGSTYGSAVYGY